VPNDLSDPVVGAHSSLPQGRALWFEWTERKGERWSSLRLSMQ